MTVSRFLAVAAMCVALSNSVWAARNAPLLDPGTISLSAVPGVTVTQATVREAILMSAQGRGWIVSDEKPGAMRLTYSPGNGKHQVTVDVNYTATNFQISFVNSFNLNQEVRDGVTLIHPNYNRWIGTLISETRGRISRIVPPLQAAPPASAASAST